MTTMVVEARDLVRAYDGVVALDGLSLEVAAGTCVGLVGPNGAGKTTFARSVMGLEEPDGGSLSVLGRSVPVPAEGRGRIGYAGQERGVYGQLSCRENLRFFARVYGVPAARREQVVEHLLEVAGLADRGDDRARRLSIGMAQRLHVACALVHDPELLVLDEPTSGVDIRSRERIYRQIEWFRQRGGTVVLITHLTSECERLSDVVHVIDRGRVVASGAPAALRRQWAPRLLTIDAAGRGGVVEEALVGVGAERVRRRLDLVDGEVADDAAVAAVLTAVATEDGPPRHDVTVGTLETAVLALTGGADDA